MVEISRAYNVPHEEIEAFMRELQDCVVLRNFDVFANLERGGDIDLLVNDATHAERVLLAHLGPPLWITRRSYVHGYFYPWGHLDLVTTLSWRGAQYISREVVLAERRRADTGIMKPRLAHEALISWFSSLLYGGHFKERYRTTILRAAHEDAKVFRDVLVYAAGKKWGHRLWCMAAEDRPEASAEHAHALRRAVWRQSFQRNPRQTFQEWLAHWRTEVYLRLCPPLPWMAVLGPDCSEKTRILKALEQQLQSTSISTVRVTDRSASWRLSESTRTATKKYGNGALQKGSCSVPALLIRWVNEVAAYWADLVHQRAKNHLLLSERHYVDFLLHPACRQRDSRRRMAAILSRLSPRPDLIILLDVPAHVLQQRQPDLTLERAYRVLAKHLPEVRVVGAAQPLAAVTDAAEALLACIAKRQSHPIHAYS